MGIDNHIRPDMGIESFLIWIHQALSENSSTDIYSAQKNVYGHI